MASLQIDNACYALTASANIAIIPSCSRISCITPHFLVFLLGVSTIVMVPCAFSPDSGIGFCAVNILGDVSFYAYLVLIHFAWALMIRIKNHKLILNFCNFHATFYHN